MDRNKLWLIGAVLVAGCLVAGGWFVGIQPQLVTAENALQQRTTVKTTNLQDEAILEGLRSDYSKLPQLEDQLSSLQASVPESSAASDLVKELDALSASSGATVTDFTMSDAQAYAPVAAAASPSGSSSATTTSSTTSSSSNTSAAGVPPIKNSMITASNFAAQPVTVTVSGSYGQVLAYLQGIQTGPRLFLVDSIAINSSSSSSGSTASGLVQAEIGGLVYSLTSYDPAPAQTDANAAGNG
jgi:Tfp pilus assembly protein PilO